MTDLVNCENLNLTNCEKIIISKINENPAIFINSTITQIARFCFVSEATVTRTIQHLGFKNIKKFQLYLYEKITIKNKDYKITKTKNVANVINNTSTYYSYTINETIKHLNFATINEIISVLNKVQKIYIFGTNQNFYVCNIFASNLISVGYSAFATCHFHDMIKIINNINISSDLLFILSNSLLEKEIKKILISIKKLHLKVCLITDNSKSATNLWNNNKIYKLTYKIHPKEQSQNLYASVKIGELLLTDILFNILIENNIKLEEKFNYVIKELKIWDSDL